MQKYVPPQQDSNTEVEAESPLIPVRSLMRFAMLLWRHKFMLTAILAVTLVLGGIHHARQPRVYSSKASVLIQEKGSDANSLNTSYAKASREIQTYQQLLTTDVVLQGAVEHLEQVAPDLQGKIRAGQMKGMITTRRIGDTNIFTVDCRSNDPRTAFTVVNVVTQSFQDFIDQDHESVAVEIVRSLDAERTAIVKQIAAGNQELFRAKQNCGDLSISEAGESVHPLVERVHRINEKLLSVQQTRVHLQAVLTGLRENRQVPDAVKQYVIELQPILGGEFAEHNRTVSPAESSAITTRQRQIIADEAELAVLSQHYAPAHSKIVELKQQISHGRTELAKTVRAMQQRMNASENVDVPTLIRRVEVAADSARRHENALSTEYEVLKQQALQLNERLAEVQIAQRDLDRLRHLHESLLNRIASIDISNGSSNIRATIVGLPVMPNTPVSPKLSKTLLLSLAAGVGIWALIVFIRDLLNDRFHSPEELREQLRLPVLATVRDLSVLEGTGPEGIQVHVASGDVQCEAFRTLRTGLTFSGEESERLSITSSEPGDGKTTVVANLAASYAQAGRRTLVVDADMRKPGLSRLFDMRRGVGLSDVLRSAEPLEDACRDAIRSSGIQDLDILPCGARPGNPSELLSSRRLDELIAWCDSHYDQVLIDCPPVLAASDAAVVGQRTDGIILVVQPEKSHRRMVLRCREELLRMHVRLFGVVANRVTAHAGSEYGYGYGYGNEYGDNDESNEPDESQHSDFVSDKRAA